MVIPVKDDSEVLARCLRLLQGQTLAPLEIVVVDNNCRDDSAEIAVLHGARDIVEHAAGIPAASAAGYDSAVGAVIVRCDADSAPPPDWLERIQLAFAADASLDALVGTGRFYDLPPLRGKVVSALCVQAYLLGMRPVLGHVPLWGSNMAYRRQAWQEISRAVHRDDPELHDDLDLSFHFGPYRSIRYDRRLCVGISPRPLYGRRQILRRLQRTIHTVTVHWSSERPWRRR
ncbi:glycosyltransferase [Arthrobacter deserti]|uniref:4,4'-diaponeurosporenoate glycosyltransferase n=1 Tax=Arthrobacter deserti TaxID=1742687 RepID=A0ABX1JQT6_9MICC|nr:glycosyltransferase [Arthrobacter deserti]